MSALKGYDKFLFDYLQLKPAQIKSFIKSNVWGVFRDGQSIFKKGHLIECHFPIVSNKNIFY